MICRPRALLVQTSWKRAVADPARFQLGDLYVLSQPLYPSSLGGWESGTSDIWVLNGDLRHLYTAVEERRVVA